MGRLNQFWRIVATGLCFSFFGIGGLLLGFLIFPILGIFVRDKLKRQYMTQRIIQQTFKLFLFGIKFTGAGGIEMVGMDVLLKDRGCLIVANHPSLIDYVMIASAIPQCDCVVKTAVWRNPFMGRVVRAAGYVPNEDVAQFSEACSERLRNGRVLLVFPEGTRTRPGKPSNLSRGAAQIATHAAADLRLVHVTVTPSFLTKEGKWYKVPQTKPIFRVEAKGKIDVEPFLREASSANGAARRLNRHLAEVLFPEEERQKLVER